MRKRINLIIVITFIVFIGYGSYTYLIGTGQDTVIKVKQVDRNGTLINSPIVLVGRFLHNYSFNPKIQGYNLINNSDLPSHFTRHNQNLTLKYDSSLNTKHVANTLSNSYLMLSMSQELSTTSLGGSQKMNQSASSIARLRVLTSNDGTSWQRLNIDYPNIQMNNSTPFWNGSELYVYFGKKGLYTKNFSDWKTFRWSNYFDNGKIEKQHIFTVNGKIYMLVVGHTTSVKRNGIYYAQINAKNGTVKSSWKRIISSKIPSKLVDVSVNYQDNKYYLASTDNRGRVKVFTSDGNLDNLKASKIVLNNDQYSYQSAQIISTKDGLLMCYTLVDRKTKFSNGMMYRRFLKHNKSLSEPQKANIDFTTHDFSIR